MPTTQRSSHATGRRDRRLSPRPRKLITVVHVTASVALAGQVWVLVVLTLLATLTEDLRLAHTVYRLVEFLVATGGIPLSITALISGIALALGTRWGLVRHYWVFAKLLLLVAVILVGMLLLDPVGLATAIQQTPRPVGRQWTQVAVPASQLVMLITATALSIYKPRGRIGARR